jgi:hypothetical protein
MQQVTSHMVNHICKISVLVLDSLCFMTYIQLKLYILNFAIAIFLVLMLKCCDVKLLYFGMHSVIA